MEQKTNQKICPNCHLVNADFVKVCLQCGYAFPMETVREISDSVITDLGNKPSNQSVKKCDNPKAPKKTCPSCGARVYINRAVCPECNYEFEFKGKKSSQNKQTTAKKVEIERTAGIPIKSYLCYLIPMLIWFLVCFFVLPLLYSKIGLWMLIVDFIAFCVAIGLGAFFGNMAEEHYEYRSSSYAVLMAVLSIAGILLFDYFQIKDAWSGNDFEKSLIHTCMLIVISAEIITQAISYCAAIKEYYCDKCQMANLVFLVKTEDGESHVEYKFVTHAAETHTATVSADSKYTGSIGAVTPEHFEANKHTEYTVKYKTPEWQENLGLHKYTKYTHVYQCKRCGYIKKENGTREEKI